MKVLHSICQKEEQEIREMQKRQRELHLIPTPICYLGLEVFDGGGEKIAEYQDRSKSWTRNWYNFIASQTMGLNANSLGTSFGPGTICSKSTSGSVTSSSSVTAIGAAVIGAGHRGGASSSSVGVVVGTGVTAESFEDFRLSALIAHGTGAGQFSYGEMAVLTATWDGVAKKFIQNLERNFLNYSGASIDVNEVGLHCYFSGSGVYTMTARDLLAASISVPINGLLKVKYTQEITLPV